MFTRTASFYDAVYRADGKDYPRECARLRALLDREIRSATVPANRSLLDVACGTGAHAEHLARAYRVEGIDLDPNMIGLARRRVPAARFHQADMVEFDLGRRFDAVVCLFSSIGYAGTEERLIGAVSSMAAHLEPGGVLIIEPWLRPDQFQTGYLGALFVDEPDLKIARMSISTRIGNISDIEFEYLIGTPDGIRRETEKHELCLFTDDQYRAAFAAAGLSAQVDPEGLMGRGIFWARRDIR